MKSPFPGMDPYLEQAAFWSDFHAAFINYWREAIADLLPPQYEATIGERVYLVEHEPDQRKLVFPDVAVTHGESSIPVPAIASSATATLEPVTIPLLILEGPRETHIEIVHKPERSLVTTLELLSPAKKEQPGRTEYLAKRRALLLQKTHLGELDLLVEGRRLPLQVPLPKADYYYRLARGDRRPDCQVYPWTLRKPLPAVPVPLRGPDSDIIIELGAVFATAYERGRFFRRIDYTSAMLAFLSKADRHWSELLLQSHGFPSADA